jgi:hypothetical protein
MKMVRSDKSSTRDVVARNKSDHAEVFAWNRPRAPKPRVLVVGDVMLDRYWFGDVARISPEAPRT